MSTYTEEDFKQELELSLDGHSPYMAFFLWLCFGAIGGHRQYLGKNASGAVMALMTIAGFVLSSFPIGLAMIAIVAAFWLFDGVQLVRSYQALQHA